MSHIVEKQKNHSHQNIFRQINFLEFFVGENVVFTKVWQKTNCEREISIVLSALWKLRKFSLTLFSQKIRESNGFAKEITKQLI